MIDRAAPRHIRAVVTLVFLSPVIAEVLYGSTHLTTLFLLIPQMAVYGCAALIIREVVRRRGGGWPSILLLGIAFSIAEECLILQTSLAPLFFAADPFHVYGRALGVNWPYLLWALGYESVWSIVIPIQLTEMIFPAQRKDPWLGTKGIIAAAVIFIAGSIFVWFIWSQVAMKQYYHGPPFRISPIAIVVAALTIAALSSLAFAFPRRETQVSDASRELRLWLVMLMSFVWGLAWFVLVVLATGYVKQVPAWVQMALGILLAGVGIVVIRRLVTRFVWTDGPRLALIFGVLTASMSAGVVASGITLPIDMAAKIVFDVVAVVLLIRLFRSVRRRSQVESAKLPA